MATKLTQASGGDNPSVGGGQFDSELKQQQRQINEQGAKLQTTAGKGGQGQGAGAQMASNGASKHAEPANTTATPRKLGSDVTAEDVTGEQKSAEAELLSVEMKVVVQTDEMMAEDPPDFQETMIESPETITEHALEAQPTLDIELDATTGGNNLPVGVHENIPAAKPDDTQLTEPHAIAVAAQAGVSEVGSESGKDINGTVTQGADSADVAIQKGAVDGATQAGLAASREKSAIAELVADTQHAVTSDSAKAAVAAPLTQGGRGHPVAINSSDATTHNGTVAGANTSANPLGLAGETVGSGAGSGAGGSGSMAGRQQQANGVVNSGQTEGDAADAARLPDKAAAFLETLKSVSKGVDLQHPATQGGAKLQPQPLSQLISQLSPAQGGTQGQAATAPMPPVATVDSTPAMMSIATSMRQQGWDRAMGERLVFMARNGIQEAQIQVNPRQLGPIEIKVSVNQEQQANVTFITTNSAARDTIDAALPRLREMFDQAGLNLAESDVSQRDQHPSEKGGEAGDERASNELAADGLEDGVDPVTMQVSHARPAGLDLFA